MGIVGKRTIREKCHRVQLIETPYVYNSENPR